MFSSLFYLRALSLLWALAICPLAALLLMSCVTLRGTIFALAALLLGIAPGLAWINPPRPWFRRAAWLAFGSWALLSGWLIRVSPDGRPPDGARVQNRYADGGWHYQRYALGALLPEIDQFQLGFPLIPAVDRLFTRQQAQTLTTLTRTIYAEMEADPAFHALGSVMPDVYDHLWRSGSDHGHYFLYIPPQLDRKTPAPALVFLHGAGGNFKAYTWLLSRVADERGMVLIVPSFGMGSWDGRRGVPAVTAALDDAAKVVLLDQSQVHLAGLSNGGRGISLVAASEAGRRFRSLVFLSPVFDEHALTSATVAHQWRDKPVLIVTGENDDRIPLPYVNRSATILRNVGAKVEMTAYPNADHLLIFTHRDQFLAQLSAWLKQHSNPSFPFTERK